MITPIYFLFLIFISFKRSPCVFLSKVDMYAGALFIQLALQWNIYIAVALLLSITAVYTIAGELSSHPKQTNKHSAKVD